MKLALTRRQARQILKILDGHRICLKSEIANHSGPSGGPQPYRAIIKAAVKGLREIEKIKGMLTKSLLKEAS